MTKAADPERQEQLARVIEDVRREHVPDFRSGVFDVELVRRGRATVLVGQSTHGTAVTELVHRLREHGTSARDEVVRLPDPALGGMPHALVRAAVAPVYTDPRLPAPQISQLVLGMRVELLSRQEEWVRVRAEDGYIGWVHSGYVMAASEEQAFGWERGTAGEPAVSLGAELTDEDGRALARLPWGARVVRRGGRLELPDGRSGQVGSGEVVDTDRLSDRFPARGESVARTARRWLGAPYLWGGVTLNGVDCSGFTQSVMWMHGIALPRDSDLQERTGAAVEIDDALEQLRAGDLLYVADPGARVSHVAFSLGGPLIIHSALHAGGVGMNDLTGSEPLEQRLRRMLISVRRLLPD